jgi:hypothetical protein
MNDRLGDIPAWASEDTFEDEGDVEMAETAPAASNAQPKHMEHFFREIETIKSDIDSVKDAARAIGNINDQALQATTTEEENELSRQLRPLVDKTNKQAKRTKTLLGLLKEETKKLQEQDNIKQSDVR